MLAGIGPVSVGTMLRNCGNGGKGHQREERGDYCRTPDTPTADERHTAWNTRSRHTSTPFRSGLSWMGTDPPKPVGSSGRAGRQPTFVTAVQMA